MIVLLAFLLSVWSAEAATPFRQWKFKGEVGVPREKFVAIPLAPRDLDRCEKAQCSDLRVVDLGGSEIPYAVVFEGERRTERELTGAVMNRESPAPGTSRLTIDFGSSLPKNRITVETSGESFRRKVAVEGSGDLLGWAMLRQDAWLTVAGAAHDERFEAVEIGLNTYRYLRVTVWAMPEESSPPKIERISCKHIVVRPAKETAMAATILSYSVNPTSGSVLDIDFGFRNLPVQRLMLKLAKSPDRLYRKACSVWGRNSLQQSERVRFETGELGRERVVETPWTDVGSGAVFRDASGRESMEIAVPVSSRYVRIRIDEGDSPPLEVIGVEGMVVPGFIVFEPAGQARFQVFAGNAEAPGVHYQFGPLLASLDSRELKKGDPVRFEPHVVVGTGPTPPGQNFVWVVLALAVAATAWMLWVTVRRLQEGTGDDAGPA